MNRSGDKPPRKKKQAEVEVNSKPRGEKVMGEGSETMKQWSQLVAEARGDEKLKQRLLDDPKAVLQEHGIEVPVGVEVRVVENTDKASSMALEAKLAGEATELKASQLIGVVGGAFNAFVNFGDIKGESTDKDHKDWVMILSYK
jgi:hypothetical protein